MITIAITRPMILRRVPPNRIYGIKCRATYADVWVWYEANEAGGRDLLKWAIAQIAAVILPPLFLRPASWTDANLDRAGMIYLAINCLVCVLGVLVVGVVSYVRANRLLRQRIATGATLVPKPAGL